VWGTCDLVDSSDYAVWLKFSDQAADTGFMPWPRPAMLRDCGSEVGGTGLGFVPLVLARKRLTTTAIEPTEAKGD